MKRLIKNYIKELKENCTKTEIIKKIIMMLIIFIFFEIFIRTYFSPSDLLKYKDNNLIKVIYEFKNILIIIGISFLTLQIYINRLKIITKLVNINKLDVNLWILQISSWIYILINTKNDIYTMKVILIIQTIAIVLQTIKILSILFTTTNNERNVVDLKEFLNDILEKGRFYIKEDEPEYDLLGMDKTIQKLYEAIKECKTTESFVMSLNGKWGSGKSTLINNLKSKIIKEDKNIIVLDDFNPWIYNNEKAVLIGIYENFMQKVGQEIGNKKIKKFFLASLKVVFENSDYEKAFKLISNQLNSQKEMEYYKNLINTYLKINNKKILFIIDDLDRASKDNILFLLNMIKNVLDFNNTIYLLAFDEDIVKEKLKDKIDCKFLEKIIQMPIQMPKPDTNIKDNLIRSSIRRMISLHAENKRVDYEIYTKEIESIPNEVYSEINDLRELKRILNSILNYYLYTDFLNMIDIFLIQLIKMKNIRLYEDIWNNKEYFAFREMAEFEGKEEKNRRTKIFDNIFSNNENYRYIKIVAKLFPYVDMYYKHKEYECKEYLGLKDNHIYNIEYTEMYFTEERTNSFRVKEDIKRIIKEPNIYVETLKEYDISKQVELVMTFTDDFLDKNEINKLFEIICEKSIELADYDFYLYIDMIEYAEKIIRKLSYSEMRMVLKNQKDLYMLEHFKESKIIDSKGKISLIKTIAKENKEIFINTDEYIFKDPLYKRNIFALDLKDPIIKKEIGKCINKDNILDYLKNIEKMSEEYSIGVVNEAYLENAIQIEEVQILINRIKDKTVKRAKEKEVIRTYEKIKLYLRFTRL